MGGLRTFSGAMCACLILMLGSIASVLAATGQGRCVTVFDFDTVLDPNLSDYSEDRTGEILTSLIEFGYGVASVAPSCRDAYATEQLTDSFPGLYHQQCIRSRVQAMEAVRKAYSTEPECVVWLSQKTYDRYYMLQQGFQFQTTVHSGIDWSAIDSAKSSLSNACNCQFKPNTPGPSAEINGTCGYVFDFDDTIKMLQGELAGDVKGILQGIHDRGYPIAIASASCARSFLRDYLKNNVNDVIFNEAFFNSPAFQTCQWWKTKELIPIVEHYDLDPQCTVMFDDSITNKRFADEVGLIWRQVQRGIGVAWEDFNAANATLHRTCECTNIDPWSAPGQPAGARAEGAPVPEGLPAAAPEAIPLDAPHPVSADTPAPSPAQEDAPVPEDVDASAPQAAVSVARDNMHAAASMQAIQVPDDVSASWLDIVVGAAEAPASVVGMRDTEPNLEARWEEATSRG